MLSSNKNHDEMHAEFIAQVNKNYAKGECVESDDNKEFFVGNVMNIDIEVNKICNFAGTQICEDWCLDCSDDFIKSARNKNSKEELMDFDLFKKFIAELKEAGYKNQISFNRYNEPLVAYDYLLECVRYARQELGDEVKLHFNSNGSLIANEKLHTLLKYGLNSIFLQVYPLKGEAYNKETFKKYVDLYASKLSNYKINIDAGNEIEGKYYEAKVECDKLYHEIEPNIVIYCKNLREYGCDRGGSIKRLSKQLKDIEDILDPSKKDLRTEPCYAPAGFIAVSYDGDSYSCTNMHNDFESHKKFSIGNLAQNTIWDIFGSVKNRIFIKNVTKLEFLNKSMLCSKCNFIPHTQWLERLKK